MIWLVLGLILFLGIHSVRMVLPGLREVILSSWGDSAWKGIYTAISLVGFVLIIWGYGQARVDASQLYLTPNWGTHANLFLMFVSFTLLPFNMRSDRLRPLIKNPFLLAVGLWAFGHLLANGDSASVVLFGSFLLWTILNRLSLTRRIDVAPPVVPLSHDIIAVAVIWVVYFAFLFKLHLWLFGVAPISG